MACQWGASSGRGQVQRSTKVGCQEAAGNTGQRKRETWPTCKLELRKQWRLGSGLDQLQGPGTEIGQATGFPDQTCSVCLAQSLTNKEPNDTGEGSAPLLAGQEGGRV